MTHMRISPHLIYDGQCREAFVAYQRILGGTLATFMTFGESPLAASVDAKWHARILHATLEVDGAEVNGADVLPHDYQRPQGFSVIVSVDGVERARLIFVALAEGGKVTQPLTKTFFASSFGMLTDKFGLGWMVIAGGGPGDANG